MKVSIDILTRNDHTTNTVIHSLGNYGNLAIVQIIFTIDRILTALHLRFMETACCRSVRTGLGHFSQLPLLNDKHYSFHLKLGCLSTRVRCLSISQGSSPPARTTFRPVRCLSISQVTNHGDSNQILKVTTCKPGRFL